MIIETIVEFIGSMGLTNMDGKSLIMILVALLFLYLAIRRGFEPLLLVPIAFGMLLSNLPLSGMFDATVTAFDAFMDPSKTETSGGLLYQFYSFNKLGIFPPLIFMGIGAMTDFGPLIANPKSLMLGAAAQFGIFTTFLGAVLFFGFTAQEAASIGIIGGADGPTAIFITTQLAPHLLGAVAVAAYSYMALVPVIQPPIMKALTTKKERMIKMEQLRKVSQREKILL
jgi:sodium ion-translocating decarboxylase beta subunit